MFSAKWINGVAFNLNRSLSLTATYGGGDEQRQVVKPRYAKEWPLLVVLECQARFQVERTVPSQRRFKGVVNVSIGQKVR